MWEENPWSGEDLVRFGSTKPIPILNWFIRISSVIFSCITLLTIYLPYWKSSSCETEIQWLNIIWLVVEFWFWFWFWFYPSYNKILLKTTLTLSNIFQNIVIKSEIVYNEQFHLFSIIVLFIFRGFPCISMCSKLSAIEFLYVKKR